MIMGGEVVHHEPSNVSMLRQNLEVLEVFRTVGCLQYFEIIQGHDNYVALDFARNLEGNHSDVRGVPIEFSEQEIEEVTSLLRGGTRWFGKQKRVMQTEKLFV